MKKASLPGTAEHPEGSLAARNLLLLLSGWQVALAVLTIP